MDEGGEYFLQPDGSVSRTPALWPGREPARVALRAWLGVSGLPSGPKPENKVRREPILDRHYLFERQVQCLIFLWKQHPSAVTAKEVQEYVQRQMGKVWGLYCFVKDLRFLTRLGFAIKFGTSTFTATDKGRYWYEQDAKQP